MTRQGRTGVVVVLLVALGVAIAWFFHSFERREMTFPLPARGEATWNPLYALKQSLRADGQRVEARRRIVDAKHPLGARDTVLLSATPPRCRPTTSKSCSTSPSQAATWWWKRPVQAASPGRTRC